MRNIVERISHIDRFTLQKELELAQEARILSESVVVLKKSTVLS